MRKSAIRILKLAALTVICLSISGSKPLAVESQTKANLDRSKTIRPLLNFTVGQKRVAERDVMFARTRLPEPQAVCPPLGFDRHAPNLLRNPSFEEVGPRGRLASIFDAQGAVDDRSAAADWTMHTRDARAQVTTELVKSNRLGGGASMLHITAGSNEGGVYQIFARDNQGPELIVASVWVYVKRGRVVLATGNQGQTPNAAFNTTMGSWELLQLCSDGNTTNNWFVIYSTAVEGSDFYVDRASLSIVKPAPNQCGGMLIENIVPNVTFPGGVIAINGSNFGHRQGTKLPAINRGRVNLLQVTRWTDTQILARAPLDLVGGTYRVLIYCDDSYRTSSNSLEVVVRDDFHRPR